MASLSAVVAGSPTFPKTGKDKRRIVFHPDRIRDFASHDFLDAFSHREAFNIRHFKLERSACPRPSTQTAERLTNCTVDGVAGFQRLVAGGPSAGREFSDSMDRKIGQAPGSTEPR